MNPFSLDHIFPRPHAARYRASGTCRRHVARAPCFRVLTLSRYSRAIRTDVRASFTSCRFTARTLSRVRRAISRARIVPLPSSCQRTRPRYSVAFAAAFDTVAATRAARGPG